MALHTAAFSNTADFVVSPESGSFGGSDCLAYSLTGSSCAIWGLGAVGLAVIMGCKNAGNPDVRI